MLSAVGTVDGGGSGGGGGGGVGGNPYLPAYPTPLPLHAHDWRKQDFRRPPQPKTTHNRYNGSLNGTRYKYSPPLPPSIPSLSLPPPSHTHPLSSHTTLPLPLSNAIPNPVSTPAPVNLVKDEPTNQSIGHSVSHPGSHPGGHPGSHPGGLSGGHSETRTPPTPTDDVGAYYPRLYQNAVFGGVGYPYMYAGGYLRVGSQAVPGYAAPPPLSPLEHQYSPPATATVTAPVPTAPTGQGTFVSPASATIARRDRESLRERERERERDRRIGGGVSTVTSGGVVQGFKVPSGKEGSLKHRILPRLDLPRPKPKPLTLASPTTPTSTPTPSPTTPHHNNNNLPPLAGNFTAGSLIQLATGELRRIEDMRTEDFVLSAEKSPELRLAESTVVKMVEKEGVVRVGVTYNNNRTQVEFEAVVEHPFFVYGQGWASCNPERTLQFYRLKVHRLQVGDILVSLTPREPAQSHIKHEGSLRSPTVVTTATTTSMTVRQVTRPTVSTAPGSVSMAMPPPGAVDNGSNGSRKRRWSAPDHITEEDARCARVKE